VRTLPLGLRIVLLVVPLALLPLAVVAGVAYLYLESTVRDTLDAAERRVVADGARVIDGAIAGATRAVRVCAAAPAVLNTGAAPLLAVSRASVEHVAGLTVLDGAGQTIATDGRPPSPAWASELQERLTSASPSPILMRRDGRPVALVLAPLPPPAAGAVVAEVDLTSVAALLAAVAGEPDGALALVDRRGDVLVATRPDASAVPPDAWRRILSAATPLPTVVAFETGAGAPRAVVAAVGRFSATPGPDGPVFLVRTVRTRAGTDQVGELRRTAVLMAATAIAFGLIGAGVIARTIVHPLNALLDMSRRVGEGQFHVRLEAERHDEIGQLVRAFNSMAGSLAEYQGRLVHAETFAALGRVASTVAHEVRNPLNAIRGCIEYLRLKRPDDPVVQHHAGIIAEEIVALDGFVGDFLQVARIERPRPGRVNVALLVRGHLDLHAPRAAAQGVEVSLDARADGPEVPGDAQQLGMVVENLINNAMDVMPGGGRLRVAVAEQDDRVVVSVADTGGGVPAAARQELFTPFFTTKMDGTGLGLAISRRIVEGHGGTIQYDDSAEGAVFRFSLPRRETDEISAATAPVADSPADLAGPGEGASRQ
jgi:signal transduction histidine kinase